eukprot:GHVH01015911.1.p1 GENE.GHVH01015911.1~~GHVH01015911.1.p1  ORF type:complete len:659 (+),score=82.83 GHVH01015911.1:3061-5037(+)
MPRTIFPKLGHGSSTPLPPVDVCPDCRGMGHCITCNNDAFCTKCADNPKRISGSSVPFIIRTDSFVHAEEMSVRDPCNKQIIADQGAIHHVHKSGVDRDKQFCMMRASLIKVSPIDPGRQLEDYYSFSKSSNLGKGSYGTVSKVRCLFSENVRALKTILKSKIENITRLKREILIMKRLDHPGIIRLHEVFEDDTNLYLVMEMCTGGELFDRVIKASRFSEQYASRLIKQLLSVLCYCHSNDIIHRDLKPENLLYIDATPQSRIKVIDWGFALKCNKDHRLSSVVGTPYYVSPDVLFGDYSHSCDVWSTGVILYITLCGYPPFYGADNKEILRKVKEGKYSFDEKHWSGRSKSVKSLITQLMTFNGKERLSAREALQHEWIRFFDRTEKLSPRLGTELLTRFRHFTMMNPIKRLAVTATAYMLGGKDLGHSTLIFNALDKNCDGVLTSSEVKDTFIGLGFSVDDFDEILTLMDTDGNGTIDYTEFLASTMDPSLYASEKLARVAFRVFDANCNGEISAEEIMHTLEVNFGDAGFTKESVIDMMTGLSSQPGIITFDEFWSMLKTEDQRSETKSPDSTSSLSAVTSTASSSSRAVIPPSQSYYSIMPNDANRTTRKASPLVSTYNKVAKTLLRNRSSKTPGGQQAIHYPPAANGTVGGE